MGRILTIGSAGMLGQALVAEFANSHEVIGWDHEDLDITQVESVQSKIKSLRPDLIINAAAYTDVDRAESEIEKANLVNGHAVGYLAAAAAELKIPIVHYSTEYVFDGESQSGYSEDALPNPVSAYGRSKLLGEDELKKNTDKYYLVRLSRLFGQGGKKKSFVQIMLDLSQTRSEIDVVDEEQSSPTYAPDLAARTRYILEKKLPYGIYHGANSGSCTWYQFAGEIFKIKGINVKLNPVPAAHFPRPAKRPKYGILLNTKLPAQRPWQEALKEFLDPTNY